MAITEAFPGPPSVVDSLELRKNLAGLVARDSSGVPRAGVFPRNATAIVSSTATMSVNVAAFEAALLRTGPLFIQNDGTVAVTIATAPVSNSRIDVIWVRQPENGYNGFADGSNTPLISVTAGTAAASPVKPAIPTGALELATVLVPTGATATNSGGVVITQTAQFTAASGGVVWVRNSTELTAWTPADGALAWQMDNASLQQRTGSAWRPVGIQVPTDRVSLPPNGPTFASHATSPMKYWIAGGMLHLSGIIINVSAGTFGTTEDLLGTLPVGFRPSVDRFVPVVATVSAGSTKQAAIARISSAGGVYITRSSSAGVGIGDLWNIFECNVPLV